MERPSPLKRKTSKPLSDNQRVRAAIEKAVSIKKRQAIVEARRFIEAAWDMGGREQRAFDARQAGQAVPCGCDGEFTREWFDGLIDRLAAKLYTY